MTNQTIKNMDLIIIEMENEVSNRDDVLTESSSKVLKTLINTYGTMLGEFDKMTNEKFKSLNVKEKLKQQSDIIKEIYIIIEDEIIPKLINNKSFKEADNLATTVSKMKNVVDKINWKPKPVFGGTKTNDIHHTEGLRHGKFIINKNDILNYLDLPLNSHIVAKDDGEYIEVYVVSNKNNELLSEKTSHSMNLRRHAVRIHSTLPKDKLEYKIYSGASEVSKLNVESNQEAIDAVTEMMKDNDSMFTLVKTEVLTYRK